MIMIMNSELRIFLEIRVSVAYAVGDTSYLVDPVFGEVCWGV